MTESWTCLAARPEGVHMRAWSTDAAVPISRMADIIGMHGNFRPQKKKKSKFAAMILRSTRRAQSPSTPSQVC